MNDFLSFRDRELVQRDLGDQVAEGTRPWRRVVERMRIERLAWAKRLTRLTGMRIAGTSDGRWARRVNRELLDRLAGKLELNDAGKAALLYGDQFGVVLARRSPSDGYIGGG